MVDRWLDVGYEETAPAAAVTAVYISFQLEPF
jgi:hypothetical protein